MKLPTFPKIYNVYFVAVIATVGDMLFGFDISSMSAIIGTKQYIEFFDNPHGVRQGAINSALAAGSVFGSIIAGPISDLIGRRDSIMFACLLWLVGTAIQAGVSGFDTLMAGRVLNGMGRRTMAGLTVQAWQQLSGANVMTYYVVYVFQVANLSGNILLLSSGIQYALFIIFASAIFFYIDKTGRFQVTGSRAHTMIAFSYLLIIIYALALAPVAWVYAAEVWSLETRASGMSIAAVGNWLFNFALGLFVPPGFANITWKLFIVFGVLCIGAAIQVFFTYPETCGKILEEMEEMFNKNKLKPWHTTPGHSKPDHLIEEGL
ncbi:hypothetical protein CNMCM8927_006676 [Aspergillus lentulus]|uniref:Major facilitator superfamily (MFS) profile domain-containing protein n=1 Tax=Aspergillus lentulus TaxID=293939 RepID=A0AAN6BQC4_ASPLE|nr:hypothetical protein CNMCM6069_002708 [Aspergillus lentulus]KAF4175062.1 hypothetical protein CNMCM8060_007859 [Aspergillus lentulus]KAF4191323.1 hypothetical protein CNMCM8694_002030 [Aspergillus lentulus]KAF4205036.1 hypothetical protein CNMCM8927_006676 [Aspergillus lentulus]